MEELENMKIQSLNQINNRNSQSFTAKVKIDTESINDLLERIYRLNGHKRGKKTEKNLKISIENAQNKLIKKFDDSFEFNIEGDMLYKQLYIKCNKQIGEIPAVPEPKQLLNKIIRKLFPLEKPQPSRIVSSSEHPVSLNQISSEEIIKSAMKAQSDFNIQDAIKGYNRAVKAYLKIQNIN